MSDQGNGNISTLQRPTTDEKEAWKLYWKAQGWPWRTEPEIDAERQKFLNERRAIVPDIEKGIYPFKDIKLSRADIEWLLATHENGRGPVDWSDEKQHERRGLDVRGADLRQAHLRGLPLAYLRGSLHWGDWNESTQEQRDMAKVLLSGANLSRAHLESADLREVHLEGANLRKAFLEDADLRGAHLERVKLHFAHLTETHMREAHLEEADLSEAYLERARLVDAILSDEKHIGPRLVDAQWGTANLAVVNWSHIHLLGEEYWAREKKNNNGEKKDHDSKLKDYQTAVRANRQLAVALQAQSLNEVGAHFAYRAQLCQRIVLRLQKKFGQYLFSLFLDMLTGYGYRPGRSVLWYLAVIFGFALTYFTFGHLPFFPDAFVFSLTSFHVRGFFPGLGSENS